MELGNGMPDFSTAVQPELVVTLYKNISYGIAPIFDEEGNISGVMIDWFVPSTPWDRKRMPFERLSAVDLATKILKAVEAVEVSETPDTSL